MKYPFDIVSLVRNKTFSVEARYSREEEDSPLKVFNHFSRFVFAIIAEGKASTCNIHLDSLEEINAITDVIKKDYYNKEETHSNNTSPAFTKKFFSGDLKGKTPIEVLLENPNGKEILKTQYKWLKENLEKFPKNKELMEAIMECSKLSEDELNAAKSVKKSNTYTIFEVGCRPLIRKTREDGKCFCYEAKVIYDSSRKYPVSVSIKNYYAPTTKDEKGLVNVILKEKDKASEISNDFNMTMAEWLNTVKCMNMSKEAFYYSNFSKGLALAEKCDKENRDNNKK